MTAVDIAERKARWRAFGLLFLSGLNCAVMLLVLAGRGGDFSQGLWLGLLVGCALNLLPIKRWLRPHNDMIRLLEDEGTRANRQLSCTIGFWAAVAVALVFQLAGHFDAAITAEQVGQLVATAGIVCAITMFAILELRAAR